MNCLNLILQTRILTKGNCNCHHREIKLKIVHIIYLAKAINKSVNKRERTYRTWINRSPSGNNLSFKRLNKVYPYFQLKLIKTHIP